MAIFQYEAQEIYGGTSQLQEYLTEKGGDNWRLHSISIIQSSNGPSCWVVVLERVVKEPGDSWAYNLMKSELKDVLTDINDKLSDIRVHVSRS